MSKQTEAVVSAAGRSVLPLLALMMFLQYAVYGLWLPIAARFLSASPETGGLGFVDWQISLIVGVAGAVGAMSAPFIAGQIADRFFPTERFLAVVLIVGGAVSYLKAYQTSFEMWLLLSLAYTLLYMPTIALTNSLAMSHLSDPKRQFPTVRLWGTIGWIAVAWAFPMIWLQTNLEFRWLPPFFTGTAVEDAPGRMIDSVKVAGLLSIAYGIFAWFCLPHTPPKKDAAARIAFAKAFRLVKHYRSFGVLLAAALLASTVHTIYFLQTSKYLSSIGLADEYIMPAMSLGQFAEIAVLGVLGLMLVRLGFRWVLVIGAAAYCVRYLIFGSTFLPLGFIVSAQALHGFCFACFYAAAFIYVDRIAPKDVRHSVQTVLLMVLVGFGPLIGSGVNALFSALYTPAGGELNYAFFWYTMAFIALIAVLLVGWLFRDESEDTAKAAAADR